MQQWETNQNGVFSVHNLHKSVYKCSSKFIFVSKQLTHVVGTQKNCLN